MPGIPEEIIEQIRQRADIVDIVGQFTPLKQRGGDFWGCCPFHHEKTPSFKVNPDRQAYYCFGCHASGSLFKFVQQMVNTDFVGAVRWLGDYYRITIPEATYGNDPRESAEAAAKREFRDKGYLLLEAATSFFHQYLLTSQEAAATRAYLAERGRDEATIRQFRIGYAPDSWDAFTKWAEGNGYTKEHLLATGLAIENGNDSSRYYDRFRARIMFPICDENGKVVGFSGRTMEAHPKSAKYVNSPETDFFHKSKILFGFNFARPKLRDAGFALVCEGQMDVIACHQAGISQAIASQGTAFTEDHAAMLRRSTSKVRLSFDGDAAGFKATQKTMKLLFEAGLDVSVVSLPEGEDPDSIFRVGGAEALRQIINTGEDAIAFIYRHAASTYDGSTPYGKRDIVNEVLDVIASIQDSIVRSGQCQWLAKQIGIPEDDVLQNLSTKLAARQRAQKREQEWERRTRTSQYQKDGQNAGRQEYRQPAPQSQQNTMVLQRGNGQTGTNALRMILDLIIHYEIMADALATTRYRQLLPDTPLARAVNFIMAYHEEGDWEAGTRALTETEYMSDPDVGRAVIESTVDRYNPKTAETPEEKEQRIGRLSSILREAVQRLELAGIDRQIDALRPKIEENFALLKELQDLQRKRLDLQQEIQKSGSTN